MPICCCLSSPCTRTECRAVDDAGSTLLELAKVETALVRLAVSLPTKSGALCPEFVTHVVQVPGAVPQRGKGPKGAAGHGGAGVCVCV